MTTDASATTNVRRDMACAALLPAVLVWILVAPGLSGIRWVDSPMSPPRAVDAGDFAQAVRLIESGAGVDTRYAHPIAGDPGRHTTALEEAVRAGEVDLVRVLLARDPSIAPSRRLALGCRALAAGNPDMMRVLTGREPDHAECRSRDGIGSPSKEP